MNGKTMIAGTVALVFLAAAGVGVVSAQPRVDRETKSRQADGARFDDSEVGPCGGPCIFGGGPGNGPWAGRAWARGGRGFGGPGRGGPGDGLGWCGPGFGGVGRGFGSGSGLLRGGDRMERELSLTDVQSKKLREIRDEHRRLMIKARADMDLARLDLMEAIEDGGAAGAEVDRRIDSLARLHAEHLKSTIAAHRAAQDVLTVKQLERLKDMRGWGDDSNDDTPARRAPTR